MRANFRRLATFARPQRYHQFPIASSLGEFLPRQFNVRSSSSTFAISYGERPNLALMPDEERLTSASDALVIGHPRIVRVGAVEKSRGPPGRAFSSLEPFLLSFARHQRHIISLHHRSVSEALSCLRSRKLLLFESLPFNPITDYDRPLEELGPCCEPGSLIALQHRSPTLRD